MPPELEPVTVAYQGVAGAYGEGAARRASPGAVPRGYPAFQDVFEAVAGGEAKLGVVPVENSLAGAIHQNFDLLLESDLEVAGEVIVRVRHHLLALPGVALSEVRRVYSHPQALAQSRGFLRRHGMAAVAAEDTAGAAEELARTGERDAAAIASGRAGELYGLATLAEGIEDEPYNYTRFLVLSREPAPPGAGEARKTSIAFAVRHTPGALLEALGELKAVNLSRIESRPRRDRAWSYLFHVDLEGDAAEGPVREALDGLRRHADFVKVLGSYPRAPEGEIA